MAIRAKKFTIGNGAEIRAVQVTAENYAEVAVWTKNPRNLAMANQGKTEDELTNQRVRVHTPFGKRTAEIGDWVYQNLEDEQYYVAKEAVFEETMFPVKPVPRKKKEKE